MNRIRTFRSAMIALIPMVYYVRSVSREDVARS